MKRKVNININTKGIIVFAKGKNGFADWLVMVTRVDDVGLGNLKIYGHIFYNISDKIWYFSDGNENYAWGQINNHWDFFEPTIEQKQIIIGELKKMGYKYVPILNKLIKKT